LTTNASAFGRCRWNDSVVIACAQAASDRLAEGGLHAVWGRTVARAVDSHKRRKGRWAQTGPQEASKDSVHPLGRALRSRGLRTEATRTPRASGCAV
jgi:hypothetical protein